MGRDWENLPKHLLDSVAGILVSPSDYLRFSLVCKSWYSVAKHNRMTHARKNKIAPMLLIYSRHKHYWRLYNPLSKKLLDLQVRVPAKRLCGSSKGWLVYVDRNTMEGNFGITLVNPFFRVKGFREKEKSIIRLPPLKPPGWKKWYDAKYATENYVWKTTISSDPILDANNCVVTVIHLEGGQMAFIRLGKDTAWTYVDKMIVGTIHQEGNMIDEVINLGDKCYAVNYCNELLSFDISTHSYSDGRVVARGTPPTSRLIKRYIFEGEDQEVWMIHRYMEYDDPYYTRTTSEFKVFQLNTQKGEWIEKTTLGGFAIFVGDNSTASVLASNFPGCRPNCIYFNHDRDYVTDAGPHDFGVYDLQKRRFPKTAYPSKIKKLVRGSRPPTNGFRSRPLPIWVVPTLSFPL